MAGARAWRLVSTRLVQELYLNVLLQQGDSGFLWESNPGYASLRKKWHAASTAWPWTGEICRHSQGPGKSPCSQQLPAQVSWTTHLFRLERNKEAEEKMGIWCVHVCSSTAVNRVEERSLVQDKVGVVWVCETKEKAVLRIQGGDFYG